MNLISIISTSMPVLPDDIQQVLDVKILGYTIGAILLVAGNMAYTLIRARIQRKAIAKGLMNTNQLESTHHDEFVAYKTKMDQQFKELANDVVVLADTSFRPEAKEVGKKWRNKIAEIDAPKIVEVATPIVKQVVEKIKTRYKGS